MTTLGKQGEDLAEAYIRKRGYRILERNFRTPVGEIDLIARDGEQIVFIEVKARMNDGFGKPFEAVTPKKQERIRKAALLYLKRMKTEAPARFDVISIVIRDGKPDVEYLPHAFDLSS